MRPTTAPRLCPNEVVRVFHNTVDLKDLPAFADHALAAGPVLPAAAQIDLMLGALCDGDAAFPHELYDGRFERWTPLGAKPLQLQTIITMQPDGKSVEIYRLVSGFQSERERICYARACSTSRPKSFQPLGESHDDEFEESWTGAELYTALAKLGLLYGPAFQGVEKLVCRPGEAVAWIKRPAGDFGAS